MSVNSTKNFPMSRRSYKDNVNTSKDKNKKSDEQSSEDLDDSYTSDEDVDDSEEAINEENRLNLDNLKNVLIFTVVVFIAFTYCNCSKSDNNDNKMTIDSLRENFPRKIKVISCIDQILNDTLQIDPTHPTVILLLYSGSDKLINKLTHNLALYASNLLETNTNYIEIPQKEFHTKEIVTDYGILIEKYKPILLEKRVMVVKDLQKIPGSVAQVFHTFCDEISPLVDRAVYLLTLNVRSLNGKEETIAEAALNENWNELDDEILSPLVTRVTSTVLKIEN